MNHEIAGSDEDQSGQRFLNGSVPRLRRHATSCKTAGGDSYSLPAGKDQKPFRELEGRALISAKGAVPPLPDPRWGRLQAVQPSDLSMLETPSEYPGVRYSANVEPNEL
jgi:hypothetical protein